MENEELEQTEQELLNNIDWDKVGSGNQAVDNEESSAQKPAEGTDEKPVDENKDETIPSAGDDKTNPEVDEAPKTEAFDVNKYLAEKSEGLFTNEEEFKSSLSKIKDFDDLKSKLEKAEAEKESLFASPLLKAQNELYKQGKTDDQVEEFTKLAKLGDISKLEPKEILVQQMIAQGTKRSVAEKLVERKYNLNLSVDPDVLSSEELSKNLDELEILNETMRLDSIPAAQALQERIANLQPTTIAENNLLHEEANKKTYMETLKEPASKFVASLPDEVEFLGLKFKKDEGFRQEIANDFLEFFKEQKLSNESVQGFKKLTDAFWLDTNKEKVFEAISKDAHAKGFKEAQEKYENTSGLPRENATVQTDADAEKFDQFLDNLATGTN